MQRGLIGLCAAALIAALWLAAPRPARAEDQVDLLLVLAVDISRSVDARKFALQRGGYAAALTDRKVIAAIQSVPTGRIAVCLVEWSGAASQAVMVDWTVIANLADAQAFVRRLETAPRLFVDRTAIGSAIEYAMRQIERSPLRGARRVIDVSGDGTSNAGTPVTQARDAALARGITINGLAILSDQPLPTNPQHTHPPGGLLKYYQDNVIGGPGAFALAASNHETFGQLILNKLVKEIALGEGLE